MTEYIKTKKSPVYRRNIIPLLSSLTPAKVYGITLTQEHWDFKTSCSSAFFVRIRGDKTNLLTTFYILPVVCQWNVNLQMSDLLTDFNVSKQSSLRTKQHLANHTIDIVILQKYSADKKAKQDYIYD